MVVEPLESVSDTAFPDDLLADFEPELSPAEEVDGDDEEELEWISNRDSFPRLETFVSTPSPVSVLPLAPLMKPPARARSKIRRKKRSFFSAMPAGISADTRRRRCLHCDSDTTPQWRAGPDGPKTLCNACGVRYKSGRLLPEYRPAKSPSFSPELHSKSHRRIVEMRRRTDTGTGRRGRPRLAVL
ncbi:putative GATA transcription factor 3 [Iris pallida]|uniref:GATA transcription factor 3 n=1 Tax=Iris pallida TaxID=29817 RepID=A0AAX6HQ21_IRIPA|nr:putative GATA transcription factor 3 [Iris pallida]